VTRIGWFHCLAGASGDMVLGALVDAGVPLATLQDAIDGLGVERITLGAQDVSRHGLGATQVTVDAPHSTVVRTWGNVRAILADAALDDAVRRTALDVFERLANAEARVHRTSPDLVHFHEVGAVDALADVVGAAAGLHALRLDAVSASSVATGMGMTRGEHGLIPVPAPAVLELLTGASVYTGGVPYELCTPTGAAILAATVTSWGEMPALVLERVGLGAGGRDLDEIPNVLRLVIGEATNSRRDAPQALPATVLEANVDDLDPRLWPTVISALIAAGAGDAWLTPIQMKKGRPALTVSVLCDDGTAHVLRDVLFRETSTIGVREYAVSKRALDREMVTVSIAGTTIGVKVARLDGVVVNAVPEYDDVVAAAATLGRPVKAVLAEAAALAVGMRSRSGA
jgi:uncharacterized protein (TIGR00299 family) protein